MLKSALIAAVIFLGINTGNAFSQDYDTGLGVRGGAAWGLTVKHFVLTDGAIEGLLTARFNGFNATALFEKHIPVFDTERFNFYYGGGMHLGLWNADNPDRFKEVKLRAGLDGIIGLEYSMGDLPVSVGMDWKPGFNLLSEADVFIDDIAVSLRYLIR